MRLGMHQRGTLEKQNRFQLVFTLPFPIAIAAHSICRYFPDSSDSIYSPFSILATISSRPPWSTDLDYLPPPCLIAPQHRPGTRVRLGKSQLQLRAHDLEAALLRRDRGEERRRLGVPLPIARHQI